MSTEHYRYIQFRFVLSVAAVVLVLAGLFYWYGAREHELVLSSAEKRSASYVNALKEHADRVFAEADSTLVALVEEISEKGGALTRRAPPSTNFSRREPHHSARST